MIVKTSKVNNVTIYTVAPDISEDVANEMIGTFYKQTSKKTYFIIDHDSDVYTQDGKLLLRFRKKILNQDKIDQAYDNVISFAKAKSNNRGTSSGTEVGKRSPETNKAIASNIMGYFDMLTIGHNYMFKMLKIKPPFKVRVCAFNVNYPDKWAKILPFIQEINKAYKLLVPSHYKKQLAYANQTAYHIKHTSFTTITINKNLQTAFHKDKGDCPEGFGNLVVIERGKYTGGAVVFPMFQIGVDVRMGDFLAMNNHEVHGNQPIKYINSEATRLSFVCYLRQDIYNKSKGSTLADIDKNIKIMANLKKQFDNLK